MTAPTISVYDEVEVKAPRRDKGLTVQIEDMDFDEETLVFHSPCPCGDRFEISLVCTHLVLFCLPVTNCSAQEQIKEGVDIAECPSCSLIIRVIYDPVDSGVESADGQDDFKEGDDEEDGIQTAVGAVQVAA
jgi:CSL zinc finger